MKTFDEFIDSLNLTDRENYNKYSHIRGVQTYRIIFEQLSSSYDTVTYKDVNSIVRCDKSLKELLFPFFGVLEEVMRNYIFTNYTLKQTLNDKMNFKSFYRTKNKKKIMIFPELVKVNNPNGAIDDLYINFNLSFADIVHLYEYYNISFLSLEKLNNVRDLRNKVMHHKPLLFAHEGDWSLDKLKKSIVDLYDLLPDCYKNSLFDKINEPISKTLANTNECFHNELLEKFGNE